MAVSTLSMTFPLLPTPNSQKPSHTRKKRRWSSLTSWLTTDLGSIGPTISGQALATIQPSPLDQRPTPPEIYTFPPEVRLPTQDIYLPPQDNSSPSSVYSPRISFPSQTSCPLCCCPYYSSHPPEQRFSCYSSPGQSSSESFDVIPTTLKQTTMDTDQLLPPSASYGGRLRQQKDAKEMEKAVQERADRFGIAAPPYEFLELIGKGTFGRVFRSRRRGETAVVAVKVIDVDRSDYGLEPKEKDQAIKDFIIETSVLQNLKDSKAKNVNVIHEAFAFHSQLWIVSEYCPGGSVATLMKASAKPGLEEKYIIPICRELALALKHVHELGVLHRDVKAANILITQDGQLQLCDFGVSGVLESSMSKRSTIVGTPYWMAPEMHDKSVLEGDGYGMEVDCWAFGCTVFELATGLPPNASIHSSKLHLFLQKAPRLEGVDYSAALKDFVSFILVEDPEKRPPISSILNHAYIANTEKTHPTGSLKDLIQRYAVWEKSGGQRHSLFNGQGAEAPATLDPFNSTDEDDWNFSTTDDFARSIPSPAPPATPAQGDMQSEGDDATPKQRSVNARYMTPFQRAQEEDRIRRAGMMMGRLFSNRESTLPYTYGEEDEDLQPGSDLPLRNLYPTTNDERKSMIDLDDAINFSGSQNVDLADVPTIRAKTSRFFQDEDDDDDDDQYYSQDHDDLTKRMTREWKFPKAKQEMIRPRTQDWSFSMAMQESKSGSQSEEESHLVPLPVPASKLGPSSSFRPTLKHTATEPLGNFGDFLHPAATDPRIVTEVPSNRESMIDLDDSLPSRPSTSHSTGQSSLSDYMASNPFDLEDEEDDGNSAGDGFSTIRANSLRASLHSHTRSAPSTEHPSLTKPNAKLSVHSTVESMRKMDQIDSSWEDTDDDITSYNEPPPSAPPTSTAPGVPGEGWFKSPSRRHQSDPRRVRNIPRGPMGVPLDTGLPRRRLYDPLPSAAVPSLAFRQHPRRGRSRTEREKHTPEGPFTTNGTPPAASGNQIEFPIPMPPSAEALEEDADPQVVAAELKRLLGDLTLGMKAAGEAMKRGSGSGSPGGGEDLGLHMKVGKRR